MLDLSRNSISDLPQYLFKTNVDLRIVDVSHNTLRALPDGMFANGGMESYVSTRRETFFSHDNIPFNSHDVSPKNFSAYLCYFSCPYFYSLDLSHNSLTKIPVMSLTNLAALTLCNLDLSHNAIAAIHSMDLSNKFRVSISTRCSIESRGLIECFAFSLQSLATLDLSNNRLFRLDDAAFTTLPQLSVLDLSNNNELKVMDKAFLGLEDCLLTLILNNVSLTSVPELSLPSLRELHLSRNELPSVPQELAYNLSALRKLDLSINDLTSVPIMIHSLPQLKYDNLKFISPLPMLVA